MKSILVLLITSVTLCFAQYSNRIIKVLNEFDKEDAVIRTGNTLFSEPYDVAYYLHPLPGGYFYEMVFVTDLNWNRIVYSRIKRDANGTYVDNSWNIWTIGEYGSLPVEYFNHPITPPIKLNEPRGIMATYHDANHVDVYIANSGNHRVLRLKINVHDGSFIEGFNFVGKNIQMAFSKPYDVVIDHKNNSDPLDDLLFVVDNDRHEIVVVETQFGDWIDWYGGFGSGDGELKYPTSITIDRALDEIYYEYPGVKLWVSDNGNNRIVNLQYHFGLHALGQGRVWYFPHNATIFDIETDLSGYTVYAVDNLNHRICRLPRGMVTYPTGDSSPILGQYGYRGKNDYQLYFPLSISIALAIQDGVGGYWSLSDGLIEEKWTEDSGGKYFEEGVDILDFRITDLVYPIHMNYSFLTPSYVGTYKTRIKDDQGNVIRNYDLVPFIPGYEHDDFWDGRDNNNNPAPTGVYTLEVTVGSYWYQNGQPIDTYTESIPFNWDSNPTSVEIPKEIKPQEFLLHQNYPNPFNPTTTINYSLPASGEVMINIYNILGQKIKTLVTERKAAGKYNVVWSGLNDYGNQVGSGIYFYRIIVQNERKILFHKIRKMIFLK